MELAALSWNHRNVVTVVTMRGEGMHSIGVRELKAHASDVLRRVRERREPIEITLRGRVVARLVPAEGPRPVGQDAAAVWSDMDQLAAEISARWPKGVTAAEAVQE